MYHNVGYTTMWDNEWAWVRGPRAHLINRFGLYQGTTLVVPAAARERSGLQPLQKHVPQGLKPKSLLTHCGTAEAEP